MPRIRLSTSRKMYADHLRSNELYYVMSAGHEVIGFSLWSSTDHTRDVSDHLLDITQRLLLAACEAEGSHTMTRSLYDPILSSYGSKIEYYSVLWGDMHTNPIKALCLLRGAAFLAISKGVYRATLTKTDKALLDFMKKQCHLLTTLPD